ncbi:unnamed protein product [[Actinomadura] parvosata subsp. kistnae]|nr:unnamed protein product [Actinomadura parvosata subsp. kistnae]
MRRAQANRSGAAPYPGRCGGRRRSAPAPPAIRSDAAQRSAPAQHRWSA